MRLHERFEWDEEKAESNLRKHGVSFVDAASAMADEFGDRFHLERFDPQHSDEENRMRTLASDPENRAILYLIAWTERQDEQGKVTRIISARLATKAERRLYEQEIQ